MLFSGSDAAVLTLMAECMPCWHQHLGLEQRCMHCVLDEEFDTSTLAYASHAQVCSYQHKQLLHTEMLQHMR